MKARFVSVLLALLALAALGVSPALGVARIVTPFAVVVAHGTADVHLSTRTVALIFRLKQTHWANGTRAEPVNLPVSNALRQAFSQCVLGEAPQSMENYWREMYFHGVLPPHVVDSEQAVLLFVASTPGAIGYVSSCPTDASVDVVFTIGDLPNCPKRTSNCESLQDS
jgi:ABC-type phosphate transport system substrate-binding protein